MKGLELTGSNPYLGLARDLSFNSNHRVRIGAVAVNKKQIVSCGYNKVWKTHPIITCRNPFKKIHAEVDAIIGIDRRSLEGATLYVYRELRNGDVGMCKPCDDCQAILKDAGVVGVYYTDPSLKNALGFIDIKRHLKLNLNKNYRAKIKEPRYDKVFFEGTKWLNGL